MTTKQKARWLELHARLVAYSWSPDDITDNQKNIKEAEREIEAFAREVLSEQAWREYETAMSEVLGPTAAASVLPSPLAAKRMMGVAIDVIAAD